MISPVTFVSTCNNNAINDLKMHDNMAIYHFSRD